jgi:nitrogen fixation/metabolism regulation signal transduction histidine kinase
LQRVITRPIRRLLHIARAVSQTGSYSLRAPMETEDEVGELVGGFNEMLAEIESRDRQLERNRSSLEAEVARQTADLRQLNTIWSGPRTSPKAQTAPRVSFWPT